MTGRPSAGGVVLRHDNRMLLVEQHGNSWSFPKGGLEEGETALEAARREIGEETGITELSLIRELGSYERKSIGRDGHGEEEAWGVRTRTLFLFRTAQTDASPQDSEVTQARWATIDEALSLLTHPKDKEFLRSVRDILIS